MTITETSWSMLNAIRLELGLDKPVEIELEPEPPKKRVVRPHPIGAERYTHRINPNTVPREGEIQLKDFLSAKMLEDGISYMTAWGRFNDNHYRVTVRRVNSRVLFVKVKE